MVATRLATWSAGSCIAQSRVVKGLAFLQYGTATLAMLLVVGLSNMGAVDGAKAMYVFGDSYDDDGNLAAGMHTTGNLTAAISPSAWSFPYGITWPGHPTGRWSDGYNQADTFAQLFGLPSPTAYRYVKNNSSTPHEAGVDFGVGGAGVTFAYGVPPLDTQVDRMEAFVEQGVVIKHHLKKSVALINFGVNDYDARNAEAPSFQTSVYGVRELETTVTSVVNIIAANIVRLYGLGLRNFIVTNLPLLVCIPFVEMEGMYKSCSTNSTLLNETSMHTLLLQNRVRLLNRQLPGLHVVIADQTKAFGQLFRHGSDYGNNNWNSSCNLTPGFVDPLTPCCHATSSEYLYEVTCGVTDTSGKPIYTLCKDPSKAVLWDGIHPTQAAWKAMVSLFANVRGYTLEGPMLSTWITKYNV